jgi:hypothetical protein
VTITIPEKLNPCKGNGIILGNLLDSFAVSDRTSLDRDCVLLVWCGADTAGLVCLIGWDLQVQYEYYACCPLNVQFLDKNVRDLCFYTFFVTPQTSSG